MDMTWEPWVGVNTNTDRILLTIYNLNGTPRVTTQELSAITNRYIIPEKELVDKAVYVARLRFERSEGFENGSYPGARGRATVFSETAFYVATVPVIRMQQFPTLIPPDQLDHRRVVAVLRYLDNR